MAVYRQTTGFYADFLEDRLALDGLRLAAQEVQAVRWRDQVLYCRCVLRREKEAAD